MSTIGSHVSQERTRDAQTRKGLEKPNKRGDITQTLKEKRKKKKDKEDHQSHCIENVRVLPSRTTTKTD